MKLKKVLIIGFLCTLVVALSGCEFWEGYKEGIGVKTEIVIQMYKKINSYTFE
ncbi:MULTISPECIES: hypothetical protein [Bacillus cereus group]|uniref:Uncharacterized protein n=1 Tax=Bacillus cereus MC67 TaxID=1053219 RepID=J8ES85_BACCE|nr:MULTISPECIES: hypothetical protein [Bacillus cereus group]EJQ91380.1 hypothetical protein II3_05552 [Bacillus cereus MC67]SCC63289.1 Uncharacterized protein BW664_05183 [Bacillus mycoides]